MIYLLFLLVSAVSAGTTATPQKSPIKKNPAAVSSGKVFSIDFFDNVVQNISPQAESKIKELDLNIKILHDDSGTAYAVLPYAAEGIVAAISKANTINFAAGNRIELAKKLFSFITLESGPKISDKAYLNNVKVTFSGEATNKNSYFSAALYPAIKLEDLEFKNNEYVRSALRWTILYIEASHGNLAIHDLDSVFSNNITLAQKLVEQGYNPYLYEPQSMFADIYACNTTHLVTGKNGYASVSDCVKHANDKLYAWAKPDGTDCHVFINNKKGPSVESSLCRTLFAVIDKSDIFYNFSDIAGIENITSEYIEGLTPTCKKFNGYCSTIGKKKLPVPRTNLLYYRGVDGRYQSEHLHEFIAMLYGSEKVVIESKALENDKKYAPIQIAISNYNKQIEKALEDKQGYNFLVDKEESIYFSVFPNVANRYGKTVFIVEDIHQRGVDLNYARTFNKELEDISGEMVMPYYVMQDELIGLMLSDYSVSAMKATYNDHDYVLLFDQTECLTRSNWVIYDCIPKLKDEYSYPYKLGKAATPVAIITLCKDEEPCKIPQEVYTHFNFIPKAYSNLTIHAVELFTKNEKLLKLLPSGWTPHIFYRN